MIFYVFNNGIMTETAMSGCDQRVVNWLPLFSKQAENITVITSKQGKKRFQNLSGIKIIETTGVNIKGALGLFLSYMIRAISGCFVQRNISLDETKKNIIYSASDLLADFVPAFFLKLKNKKARLIVGVHLLAPLPWKGFEKHYTKGVIFPTLSGTYYFISQFIMLFLSKRWVDLVMVSNHLDKETLIKKGFNPDKLLLTYGAVNVKEVDAVEPQEYLYDACYVGRFHSQKGFPDLIDVWKDVVAKHSNAKLIVVGYDVNIEKMKTKVELLGLSGNIIFAGFVGSVEKYKLIKQSKLMLVPSYYESFGMVILEAMTSAVTVVAYDLPVYRDIYTQGIKVVNIADKVSYAKVVISLLENKEEREKLASEARELSTKFSWDKTAADILSRLS